MAACLFKEMICLTSKLERHRAQLHQKKARLEKLQKDVEALDKQVQEEENTEIVATVRSLCLGPEALTQFLRELRHDSEAPVSTSTEDLMMEEDEHEASVEKDSIANP